MQRGIMLVAGLIALAAGFSKIPGVRRRPDSPGPKALCYGLLSLGAAFLVSAPAQTIMVSEFLRVPNSGRLIANLLALAAAAGMQVMMLHLAHPPEVARQRLRRRLILLALVAVAMTVLLVTADTVNVTNFLE